MGPFKATLPEAGMMASPKAEPLLWRMPGDPRRTRASVSADVPGGGAIALATLEPNSGGHRLQFRPELTSNQHRREVADPVPEPLGEAAGDDRPIRECDVAHRLCAEPQGPEPDGLVDHALGSRGRGWTNRFSVEPERLQVGETLLVRRGSRRRRLCGVGAGWTGAGGGDGAEPWLRGRGGGSGAAPVTSGTSTVIRRTVAAHAGRREAILDGR